MRIGLKGKTKVSVVLGAVIGLRHAAQCGHIDQFGMICIARRIEQTVEVRRFQNLTFRKRQTGRLSGFPKGIELVWLGFFVHPVKQWLFLGPKRFGGRDIGEDHAVFDDTMGGQAFFKGN